MRCVWRPLLCLFVLVAECIVALKFSGVTESVRLTDAYGKIVDFADFNADKATDLLVRDRTGSNYSLYLWSSSKERFQRHSLALQNSSSLVFTAAVDLDGDGRVDILSLSREKEEGGGEEGGGEECYTLGVYWMGSQGGRPVAESYQVIDSHVLNPPLVLDANGDHVPDVMVQSCREDGVRRLWISSRSIRGELHVEHHRLPPTTPLNHTTAYYVDLNSDYLADVVMDGWSSGERSLAFWERTTSCSSDFHFIPPLLTVPLPPVLSKAAVSSRLAFADMDGDGRMEAVVYSCSDPACTDVRVHILSPERGGNHRAPCTATTHLVNFTQVHTVSLPAASISPHTISSSPPVIGDIDLDGYPDIVVPTNRSSDLLLLVARQCHAHCNGSGVTLDPQWVGIGGSGGGGVTAAAFFDLWEDGVLDILLTQQSSEGDQLLAYRQSLQDDHAFLKVLVLSGHCFRDCTSGEEPYGSVLPGAVVSFLTTDRLGRRKRSVGTVHAGSPLQLPFLVFGLGQTPSLVEELEVGALGEGRAAHHSWKNLVPNSQIIVIPSPPGKPERWRMELYLTPGELVYSTAGVLAALFVGTAIVVLLLQAREKYQDSRERKKAKHKFHFNAM